MSPRALPRYRSSHTPWGIGIIGGGDISGRYAQCASDSPRFKFVGTARRDMSTQDLLADVRVDIVLNLTPPLAHAKVTRQALEAGKHVYSEKPLAHTLSSAQALCDLADARNLILACAPATFLGPAMQTARREIDAGHIGTVIGARGVLMYPGPDVWHHNPAPVFSHAAGPLFDMGVYHLMALVAVLGPINEVFAMGSQARATRTISKGPKAGQVFDVDVPTHVNALVSFHNGAIIDLLVSFDGRCSAAPPLEIFGTKGSLNLSQPSQFEGPVSRATQFDVWDDVEQTLLGWEDTMWIAGLHAMTDHLEGHNTSWPDPCLATHVLDAMIAIEASLHSGQKLVLSTTCLRPAPLNPLALKRWKTSYERAA